MTTSDENLTDSGHLKRLAADALRQTMENYRGHGLTIDELSELAFAYRELEQCFGPQGSLEVELDGI